MSKVAAWICTNLSSIHILQKGEAAVWKAAHVLQAAPLLLLPTSPNPPTHTLSPSKHTPKTYHNHKPAGNCSINQKCPAGPSLSGPSGPAGLQDFACGIINLWSLVKLQNNKDANETVEGHKIRTNKCVRLIYFSETSECVSPCRDFSDAADDCFCFLSQNSGSFSGVSVDSPVPWLTEAASIFLASVPVCVCVCVPNTQLQFSSLLFRD